MAESKLRWKIWLKRLLLSSCGLVLFSSPFMPGVAQPNSSLESPPERAHPIRLEDFPNVHSYDLGSTSLTQTGVPSLWATMPFILNGTLAIPAGSGPFPVVLLLHGRHPGCHFQNANTPSPWPCRTGTETRFDQGFAYLAQALAEAGYLAVAPNLNAAYANAYGANPGNRSDLTDARVLQIIAAHWQSLVAAQTEESASFPVSLQGKIDLGQVALLGHSLGGGAAVLSLQEQSSPFRNPEFGPVRALVLVSPTPSRAIESHPAAYQLPDIPTSIVVGGCDRDIYDFSSLYYFETANRDPTRQTPVMALLLAGANHNFFNPAVDQDDYYRQPDKPALCNPQQSDLRLSRVDQEDFLVQHTLDFFAHTVGKPDQSAKVELSEGISDWTSSETLYGFPGLVNLAPPSDHRQILFDPSQTQAFPVWPHASDAISVLVCQAFQPCHGDSPRHPPFPSVLYISWDETGGRLRFPVPAEIDVNTSHHLQLRLASPSSVRDSRSASGFAVVMQDEAGQAVRVEVSSSTPALQQFPSGPGQGAGNALTYPSTVDIPLLQFRGVDPGHLAAVELIFDPGSAGNLILAGVEFVDHGGARQFVTDRRPDVPSAAASEFSPAHRVETDNVPLLTSPPSAYGPPK